MNYPFYFSSIHGTALTQSSQTTSDNLKSEIFDEGISEMSQPCYTARDILSEKITNLGFNLYQISDVSFRQTKMNTSF